MTILDRLPASRWLCEIFVVANLAFLAVDVSLAHSANAFARPLEWIPVGFSVLAPLLLVGGILRRDLDRGRARAAGLLVGSAAIALGIAGFLMHLRGTFFTELTLRNLVYTAPFAAPLAYTGLGLLLLLNRLEPRDSSDFGPWVVLLALGGFAGNFALTLCDHAQNGFFSGSEWIGVAAAAFAVGFLFMSLWKRQDLPFLGVCVRLMLVQALVGGIGFVLHLRADLGGPPGSLMEGLVFGAPPFAPLLFVDLALLALLGLREMRAALAGRTA